MKPVLFFITGVLCSFSAFSQTGGVVNRSGISVYSEPNVKSEVLLQPEKGSKVTILEQQGGWIKIRVALDKSFSFEGWVGRKYVDVKASTAQPTPSRSAAPPPTSAPPMVAAPAAAAAAKPAAKTSPELDKFFEPAKPTSTETFAAPVTQAKVAAPAEPSEKFSFTKSKDARRVAKGDSFVEQLTDKASVAGSISYLIYHYSLSNRTGTPGEIFAYNLPGFGIDLDLNYWFWSDPPGKWRAGSLLHYQHGFYRHNTNLLDSTGASFGTVSSSHSSDDVNLRFAGEYRWAPVARAMSVGFSVGAEYFNFNAGDVSNDVGPIQLYISNRFIAATVGVNGKIPIPLWHDLYGIAGVDIIPWSMVSESPSNQTGKDPKGSIGFLPNISILFAPWVQHQIDVGYHGRIQTINYSGTGSRVGTSNVSDGTVDTAQITLFVRYNYLF